MRGKKHSEETKAKMRATRKGTNVGENNPMFGKMFTKEHKLKLSQSSKGRKFTDEHKRKIGLSNKGKRLGRKESEETRRKLSILRKGQKSHLWRGGLTEINKLIRGSLEYKLWREAVFKRDNYTCIWCGYDGGRILEADHIKPFAWYPELRFAIDNGRTLCVDCHKKTDTYGKLSYNHKKSWEFILYQVATGGATLSVVCSH